jgi:hypothetical protein
VNSAPRQQNLARVVDPQQEDHHRTGSAVAGRHAALAEIQADQLLTDYEEHGSDECTGRHITPAKVHVGQHAVEEGEQRCGPDERYEYLDSAPREWDARRVAREPCAECGKRSRHRERDHQQKADRDHQAEGAQTIDQECLEVCTRIRLHSPDGVQRRLELEEGAGRGDDECDAADRGGEDADSSLTRTSEKTLYGLRTFAPDQVIELTDDLAAHRVGAEDQTRNAR